MNTPVSQKGMTLVSWLFVLAVLGFLAATAFKMVPHYLDYMSLDKVILEAETDMGRGTQLQTVEDLQRYIQKGMQVNGLRDINLSQVAEIQVDGSLFKVHLDYEKREPLVYNLSLIAHFEKEYQLKMP